MKPMTRGAVARLAGVHPETLRHYERLGLLPAAPRTAAGYRQYTEETTRLVRIVRWAGSLGFTLAQIRTWMRAGPPRRDPSLRAMVGRRVRDLDAEIARLSGQREELQALAACGCTGDCPIVARVVAAPARTSQRPRLVSRHSR